MVQKKKILFVMNTMGKAGAEVALIQLLKKIPEDRYDVYLYVLMAQGEVYEDVPEYVHILNKKYYTGSVLSAAGRRKMIKTVLAAMFRRGTVFRCIPYLVSQLAGMIKRHNISLEKLLWRIISDGSVRFKEHFELAVAYLEGGSAYYVARHINADKKAAFVHVDYAQAGYNRKMDGSCYLEYDRIFTVSEEIKKSVSDMYPEIEDRFDVFHNILDTESVIKKSKGDGAFPDNYDGLKILTVGRLTRQKAYEISIEAMKLLKDSNVRARWYVLGEGDQRDYLTGLIKEYGLEADFILVGAVDNPYPWYAATDIYVHCSRFEGKSIAIQEAQILGCPMLVSDCSGNREQVTDGVDGLLCELNAKAICDSIKKLIEDEDKRAEYGRNAASKYKSMKEDTDKLLSMVS